MKPILSFHQYPAVKAANKHLKEVYRDLITLRHPDRQTTPNSPVESTVIPVACANALAGSHAKGDVSFDFHSFNCHATHDERSFIVDRFAESFARNFVLPNEIETLDSFRECLKLNADSHSRPTEPHREYILVLEDPETKLILGGLNFVVFPATDHLKRPEASPALPADLLGHIHVNFVYIAPVVRGIGRDALPLILGIAGAFCRSHDARGDRLYLFFEQNDPFKMPIQDYVTDNAFAGIDQIDRLLTWAGFGGRFIDFDYEQPPLDPLAEKDETDQTLSLGLVVSRIVDGHILRDASVTSLSTAILQIHLRRFFWISVGKGRRPPLFDAVAVSKAESYPEYFHNACLRNFRAAARQAPAARLLGLARSAKQAGPGATFVAGEALKAIKDALHTIFRLMPSAELAANPDLTVGDLLREGDAQHNSRYDSLLDFLRAAADPTP